jgi:hypothetical protein
MNKTFQTIAAVSLLAASPLFAETDCIKISAMVKSSIEAAPEQTLAVVTQHIEASPSCSCEIIKASIQASNADVELVAMIVESAILAAPDQMRLIAECAIATAPDALGEIQSVLAKLDPNAGDSYSAKSAKSAKSGKEEAVPEQEAASIGNPLDFPGSGPVGPGDGLPGGGIPGGDPGTDPLFPPVIFPNPESPVNPPLPLAN